MKRMLRAGRGTKEVKGAMCEKFVHMRPWATRDVSQSKKKKEEEKEKSF